MEQKQIDELENSYTGEEFIDEEDLSSLQTEAKPASKPKRGRPPKKTAKADVAKKVDETPKVEIVDEVKISSIKEEPKIEAKSEPTSEPTTEKNPVYDPWDDEDEASSGGSFWKLLTGVLVILLVISVFTSGFNFSEDTNGNQVTGAAVLSLSEAESEALDYVNTNLLQEPFTAELENSADVGDLYQVTMSVAGQEIDSYITKDGKLFFPQGFDTSLGFTDDLDNVDEISLEETDDLETETVEETEEVVDLQLDEAQDEVVEELVEEPVEEVLFTGETKEFTLNAKRWLFNPNEISVNKGDVVKLTITSSDLVFNFAVPDFGVEEQISGTTIVEFTASEEGSFEFACSDCESWRGMTGTLVVN